MNWEVVIGLETHAQLSTASKIFSGASTALRRRAQHAGVGGRHRAARRAAGAQQGRGRARDPLRPRGRRHDQSRAACSRARTTSTRTCPRAIRSRSTRSPWSPAAASTIVSPTRGALRVESHPRASRGGRRQVAARGLPRHDRHRPEPRRHAAARDRHRARPAQLRRGGRLRQDAARAGAVDRHLRRQHAGRQLPLRRQRVGAPRRQDKLGTRCEIKNLNSFRFMQEAIEFEVRRQVELIEDGGTVVQETRLYDPDKRETRSMRSKEDAQDYRYFPDPDLPPLADQRRMDRARARADAGTARRKRERYVRDYELPVADAAALTAMPALARYFEVRGRSGRGRPARRQLASRRVLPPHSTRRNIDAAEAPGCGQGVRCAARTHRGRHDLGQDRQGRVRRDVGGRGARRRGGGRDHRRQGLATDLRRRRDREDRRRRDRRQPGHRGRVQAGKDKAFNSLVGKVMAATRGKANPAQVNELLRKKLG